MNVLLFCNCNCQFDCLKNIKNVLYGCCYPCFLLVKIFLCQGIPLGALEEGGVEFDIQFLYYTFKKNK